MDGQRVLNIVLQLQDQASAKLAQLSKSLNADQVKKGANMVALGFEAMGMAVVATSAISIKMASDFQSSMLLIQTQAGASATEVKKMSQVVLDLAPAVGQTPEQLAQGLFFVESAGYRGAKALDILKLSAEGAAVGHDDLISVVKALTSVVSSGITGIKNTTDAMGVLDAIVGHGKMTMSDLTSAIGTGILPAAKQVGLSLQDVGATLDVMTNNGIPAVDAMTRFRMTLSLMESPTQGAIDQLKSVGLTQRSLADDMRKGGIIQAITDLNTHMNAVQPASTEMVKGTKMTATQLSSLGDKILTTNAHLAKLQSETKKTTVDKAVLAAQIKSTQDKLTEYSGKLGGANEVIKTLGGSTLDAVGKAQLLTKAFGGARSGTTIELLTQQTDKLKDALGGINSTSSKFASSWQATQKTNAQAMARLNATVQTLAIEFGNKLLPIVTTVANFLTNNLIPAIQNTASFFEKHKTAMAILAGVMTALLVPALVAVAMQIGLLTFTAEAGFALAMPAVVTFGLAVIAAFWPIMLIAGAVAIAAVLIITHWKQISAFAKTLWKDISSAFDKVRAAVMSFASNAVKDISGFIKGIQQGFDNFGKFISATFTPIITDAFDIITFPIKLWWDLNVLAFAAIIKVLQMFAGWFQATFGKQIKAVFDFIKLGLQEEYNFFVTIWTNIKNFVSTAWNAISSTITNVATQIWDFISTTFTTVYNFVDQKFLTPLSNVWKNIWNGIKTFTSGLVNDIWGFIKGMINNIIGGINGLIRGFDKVGSKVPGFVKLPEIKGLATGTNFWQGGMALVGEQGPELVNLPRGSQVIPNNQINHNNNASVTLGPVYVSDVSDMNMLVSKLDFYLKTSGRY